MPADGNPLTFLFTDIVGSTHLWQRNQRAMEASLEIHDAVIRKAIDDQGGAVFAGGGDGFGAVFRRTNSAVHAALVAQDRLQDLAVDGEPLKVRMGLHTGVAQRRNDDYFGLTVNRAARLSSAAHGGQVLVSGISAGFIDDESIITPLGVHRLADLLEPIAVFQAGAGEFPPINSLNPNRHNLPVRFTSFVGRDDLVSDVAGRLETERLITLVGPGGIGKTSLALEVGVGLVTSLKHGVWLAELDQLHAGADIDGAIAGLLGMTTTQGWERTAAGRDQLIILDNAEHLVDGVAASVMGLLRAGEQIRFLITSREPLSVPGETVVDLPPLPLAEEATELFMDRAQLSDSNREAVTEIVDLTDGIPLVIELVAANASRIPLEDLRHSLGEHGFGGIRSRGVAARHQSSRAAVEWSYQLLAPDERQAFASLAVFAQDFSLRSAAAAGGVPSTIVRGLIEKSLVHRTAGRFRLLEPIREFAGHLLREEDGWPAVRARHASHVAEEIDRLAERLRPRMGEEWERRLDVTPLDVIAACRYAIDGRDIATLTRLFQCIPGAFGYQREYVGPLLEVLDDGLDWLESDGRSNRWMLLRYAWTERFLDRDESARERAKRLRAIALKAGDDLLVGACDAVILSTTVWLGDGSTGQINQLINSLRARASETDWWEQSGLYFELGEHLKNVGRYSEAEAAFRSSLGAGPQSGRNAEGVRVELAGVLTSLGNPHEALELLEDVEMLSTEAAQERAHALIATNDPEAALRAIQEMVELDLQEGQPTVGPFCAAADYFREIRDHRASVLLLARMLEGEPAWAPIHHNIINEAHAALGEEFESEWRRGEQMDVLSLYGLIGEA